MKKAFTMIEVIFVIVIIGILAAVAIPRLAASRDDSTATVCVSDVSQMINDISGEYIKVGYADFKIETITSMTHVPVISSIKSSGIKIDSTIDTTGVTYVCEGEDIATIVGEIKNGDYNLTITALDVSTVVSSKAKSIIVRHILNGNVIRSFNL